VNAQNEKDILVIKQYVLGFSLSTISYLFSSRVQEPDASGCLSSILLWRCAEPRTLLHFMTNKLSIHIYLSFNKLLVVCPSVASFHHKVLSLQTSRDHVYLDLLSAFVAPFQIARFFMKKGVSFSTAFAAFTFSVSTGLFNYPVSIALFSLRKH